MFRKGSKNITAICVINLDHQTNRWKQMEKETLSQKINKYKTIRECCYRIPALYGREINLNEIDSKIINCSYQLKDQYYVDPELDNNIWFISEDTFPSNISFFQKKIFQ